MRPGRLPRLYFDDALSGSEIRLAAKQAHYLRQVLRLKPGHSVVLFDGRGTECVAEIAVLARDGASLRVTSTKAPLPEAPLSIHLLQAIAKAEPMDLIVQKATELGVRELTPVVTEFCVVRLDAERAAHRVEHWRRIAQSACEQSGRHVPMQIHTPCALADGVTELATDGLRLTLDPDAEQPFAAAVGAGAESLSLLVGPEGGLSERDLRIAALAGFAGVRMGPRTLRVETAAIAACALAQSYWGDLG
jgi:16S rRNA (uracil1498-N3)-methyltransferase